MVAHRVPGVQRLLPVVLVPEGPFSLGLARTAVMRWAPVSRFARDAARPLVLAAVADDDLRPVAFALRQDELDGPVAVEITGTGDPEAAARNNRGIQECLSFIDLML